MVETGGRTEHTAVRNLAVAVSVFVLAALAVLLGPWPLGVPGEWTWSRHAGFALAVIPLLMLAAVYLVIVQAVAKRLPDEAAWWSGPLLVAAGFLFTTSALHAADLAGTAAGATRTPWVIYLRGTSGYYSEAVESQRSTAEFLRGYEATVAEGEYLHQGTHPPGLILLYRGLTAAVEGVPFLQSTSESLRSRAWADSWAVLRETSGRPPDPVAAAVLWWASTLTSLAGAAAAWPAWLLIRRVCPADVAWRLAALWPLVPAAFVFLPKSDCLFPVLGLTVAALWIHGVGGSRWSAFAAGLIASLSLWLSLALAPVFAGVAVGSVAWAWRSARVRELAGPVVFGAIGFGFPIAAAVAADLNIVSVWLQNLRNHAAFYDHFPRTYLAWLPVNLIEGVIAASPPLVAAAVLKHGRSGADGSALPWVVGGVLAAWFVLWLSGKNMGEAARLWVLLTPWPLIAVAARGPLTVRQWWIVAAGMAVVFAVAGSVVDGFNLAAAGS